LGADKVEGVIHGAGVIADRRIEEKTADDFDLVCGVKIKGLQNLLEVAEPDHLQWIVLFSSVAGFYGNRGQADYALANAVLDRTAHWLTARYPDCRVMTLNWGPWDGGMVTPALKRMMEGRGIELIPLEAGTAFLAETLGQEREPPTQQIVGASLGDPFPSRSAGVRSRPYIIERHLSLEANPFLRDHVIGGHAVLPTVCAVAWMINACEHVTPGYNFVRVSDYRVYKGLVFDESLAPAHQLEIREVLIEEDRRVFDTRITSETSAGMVRNHYQARIELRSGCSMDIPRVPVDLHEVNPGRGKPFSLSG
jgi:hypothetical protein